MGERDAGSVSPHRWSRSRRIGLRDRGGDRPDFPRAPSAVQGGEGPGQRGRACREPARGRHLDRTDRAASVPI